MLKTSILTSFDNLTEMQTYFKIFMLNYKHEKNLAGFVLMLLLNPLPTAFRADNCLIRSITMS